MTGREILSTHPAAGNNGHNERLIACIEACFDCAQACTACADACLNEKDVAELTTCIRADLDCADMCEATGRLLSRYAGQDTNLVRAFLDTCAAACRTCGAECDRHAETHEHCRLCAMACHRCEQACEKLVAVLA
jgi:uncharacterized protein DUF326